MRNLAGNPSLPVTPSSDPHKPADCVDRAALERPLDLYNIREFDSALGSSLETLYAAHRTWLVGSKSLPMLVDGSPIEDLCLTFELPGTDLQSALPLSLPAKRSSETLAHHLLALRA